MYIKYYQILSSTNVDFTSPKQPIKGTGMSFAQQTSSISEKWKAMTDEDKAPYTALLVEDQARYRVRRERESI